mmetsp:Transcript_12588/g.23610  ORF Transcript_12588/g.23610 Transcript_12588/m.23610 type:complete len:112 (+) Transcript_12588:98-433(+)
MNLVTRIIILSFLCQLCKASPNNSFSDLVLSYGDFERCSFGLCRHHDKIASINNKHDHSVHVIKKASGGGQRRRMKNVTMPPKYVKEDQIHHVAVTRNVVRRCRPNGWGMF